MPLLISALLGALVSGAGSIVGRVLISLGIGYATFQGVDLAFDFLKSQSMQYLDNAGNISPVISQLMGILQIGTCLNILFSAFTVSLGLKLTGGVLKKMVIK